jgi:KilA-N domain
MKNAEHPLQNIVIRGRSIRFDETGLACLNDIWSAAGYTKNQRPGDWSRLGTTHKRIELVLKLITGKSRNYDKADMQRVLRTRRGADGGTYADARLALDYAEYLNPKLAIEVKETFLRYKAADPSLADEVMENAGAEANEWMAKRSMGRAARLNFTATLKAHGVKDPSDYGRCTNATYQGLFGKSAGQLRASKGLAKNDKLRDRMTLKELVTVSFSEVLSCDRIEDEASSGFRECYDATAKVANSVKAMMDNEAKGRQPRLIG